MTEMKINVISFIKNTKDLRHTAYRNNCFKEAETCLNNAKIQIGFAKLLLKESHKFDGC